MLIKLASVRRSNSQPLRELARVVAEKGQKSIYVVSEILAHRPGTRSDGPANG